jgi:DNA mismatch repair protein MutH
MKKHFESTPNRLPAPVSRRALEVRAAALAGHTVAELAAALNAAVPANSRHAKGFVGQLVEHALGADPQARERPDFPDLGVELKTIPTDADGRPVASTFVCSIAMADADRAEWASSIVRHRLACVLFVPVLARPGEPIGERKLGTARLWTPSAAVIAGLRADWEDLIGAIGAGRGGSLTAREGRWLQVRPKAAHAGVRTLGPSSDGVARMLPLGFYLRPTFTRQIFAGVH